MPLDSATKRPLSVTILAAVYLATGVFGLVFHFPELWAAKADAIEIELTEFAAFVCGVSLLCGKNWARWLAMAWIVFHVVLSAFHPLRELAVHVVFCAVIAGVLFRPAAARYFGASKSV